MSNQIAAAPARVQALAKLAPMMAGNIVLPYLIYLVGTHLGLSTMTALTVSAIPPVVLTVFTALRKHRLDALGLISLVTIATAIATAMLTGNARFMLAKDGLFPLVLGLAMLVSLLAGKPLIFYVISKVFAVDNAEVAQRLDQAWRHEGYRHALRRYTAIAGVGLLAMVVVDVSGAFTLPIGFALPALNVFQIVVSSALVIGIRTGLRRSMRAYTA
ncbi:MAG TPA: VC0807 family protein [Pseudonocardiaceae bacterium]|nr:VC0807 family protein [Pseudonocardiaceae bacterium]